MSFDVPRAEREYLAADNMIAVWNRNASAALGYELVQKAAADFESDNPSRKVKTDKPQSE